MRGCLVAILIFAVLGLSFYFFVAGPTENIDREYPGIMYTTDGEIEEQITVKLRGALTEPLMSEPTFEGEIEITGDEIYYSESIPEIECAEGIFFLGFPEQETPEGIVSGSVTISDDLEKLIGSLSLNNKYTYYFGAPGESLEEILAIKMYE
ncbi:hypothetical protein [Natranaerobius thermophilus]|uniref:Uncharacterized protein n=1 Tax=Natranaerobius thermophilus (strain ATCC BAA-1301 / DSM 18059 / JW/NM-WN-LF) TaxID=457570 RepID=B2A4W7_NATTJ|nr:hypothetical protein [Natranaerobius thermophilus]ACB83889.1 hypothetical protein Nther_0291 [Natranaerobius thermophilus JW/NM-WN-LF]